VVTASLVLVMTMEEWEGLFWMIRLDVGCEFVHDTWQSVAVCASMWQYDAVYCTVWQSVALCGFELQCG